MESLGTCLYCACVAATNALNPRPICPECLMQIWGWQVPPAQTDPFELDPQLQQEQGAKQGAKLT